MDGSAAKPSDIILKLLKDIVESWEKKSYKKLAEQCVALLKRRKAIENLGMTVPLQRILLQSYILQNQYEKVLEWEKARSSSPAANVSSAHQGGCDDLVLYARYRTEDYAAVSKNSAIAGANSDQNTGLLFKNLQAQSDFHLNRTEDGLAVYLQLLAGDSISDDDLESRMELLTNALALIASSGCTPMVNLDSNDENLRFWLEEAESMLLRDEEAVDGMFADLASNLGCIQFLTDPTKLGSSGTEENWLEEAADTGEDEDAKQGTAEQINLQWSKHFWYKDIEDVEYASISKASNVNKLSVTESVAKANQSLIDENLTQLPSQPHPKWNSLQVRMYWYNRAILQFRAKKYVECHDSCQSLKKALSSLVSAQTGGKKKKKIADATAPGSNISKSPTTLWWEARADVILAYTQQAQSKYKEASARLSERVNMLKTATPSFEVDHAITHVLLHQFVLEQQQQKGNNKDRQRQQKELFTLLKSLPESIKSRPATHLTIDELQDAVDNSLANNEKKNRPANPLEEADLLFGESRFEEACKSYENALSGVDASSSTEVDSQLRYVQALAMIGRHEESHQLWQSLESTVGEENIIATVSDGKALENKALPRSTASNSRSSISNKLASTGSAPGDEDNDKPSREKVLRRRAVKREAYLKELESKGNYNPDRPTKPDPERWIPKHERRSRGRNRGNRGGGRNNNKGLNSAQGGGSKLDAERLDAAARRAGKTSASTGPSSANLKVSSGGRKGGRRR